MNAHRSRYCDVCGPKKPSLCRFFSILILSLEWKQEQREKKVVEVGVAVQVQNGTIGPWELKAKADDSGENGRSGRRDAFAILSQIELK